MFTPHIRVWHDVSTLSPATDSCRGVACHEQSIIHPYLEVIRSSLCIVPATYAPVPSVWLRHACVKARRTVCKVVYAACSYPVCVLSVVLSHSSSSSQLSSSGSVTQSSNVPSDVLQCDVWAGGS